jgi:hypothetical protein
LKYIEAEEGFLE